MAVLSSARPAHYPLASDNRSYIIEDGIIFLAMADKGYPKKLAFSYLVDVQRNFAEELSKEYGDRCGARAMDHRNNTRRDEDELTPALLLVISTFGGLNGGSHARVA